MEKNRQISCAEFQIIYCSQPALKESEHNSPECGLCLVISLQRGEYGMGETKSNFTVEKTHKYYLGQDIKVNINSAIELTAWEEA